MSDVKAPGTPPRHTNRLIHETSPYLLQHAHNPVDWHPWGEEALARAKAENTPILLSVGYSACHWCHVMERESFENEDIAALMNRHFVNIKVDREERPDLDEIYMAATVALNQGQGGWPMTVFLTPDQQPFFAGTYFAPTDGHGRPGFATLLTHIARLWQERGEDLKQQAAQLTEYLKERVQPLTGGNIGETEIRAAASELAGTFDKAYGGFGPAPKFPPSTALHLLLRHHRRTGDPEALSMVTTTLEAMARGGIYDHIGGGFARYSTDERWLVPHFEKMLYDNALLARAYLEGFQATGNPVFARIARETLDYVLREMTGPEGGFYSSTDADSEGEEGKFFVWTPGEVEAVLGPEEGAWFCAAYDISDEGNWEGKSIPNMPRPAPTGGVAPLHRAGPAHALYRGWPGQAVRGPPPARAARVGRQGPDGLERHDGRRAGRGIPGARRPALPGGCIGRRRLPARDARPAGWGTLPDVSRGEGPPARLPGGLRLPGRGTPRPVRGRGGRPLPARGGAAGRADPDRLRGPGGGRIL